jgi:hypothetical protein
MEHKNIDAAVNIQINLCDPDVLTSISAFEVKNN